MVRVFRWALKDLKQAMLGRALPSGARGAPSPSLLPPKYLPAYRAFLCHVKDIPTPLLMQAAAAFGITIDSAAVEAERAAAQPKRVAAMAATERTQRREPSPPAVAGTGGELGDVESEAVRYLRLLREVVAENRWRIAGLGSTGPGAQGPVPVGGYVGAVGRALGAEVLGLKPAFAKHGLARRGVLDQRRFRAVLLNAGVLVGDAKYPGMAAAVKMPHSRAGSVAWRLLCFRRDAVGLDVLQREA